jgi:hypothetical protein
MESCNKSNAVRSGCLSDAPPPFSEKDVDIKARSPVANKARRKLTIRCGLQGTYQSAFFVEIALEDLRRFLILVIVFGFRGDMSGHDINYSMPRSGDCDHFQGFLVQRSHKIWFDMIDDIREKKHVAVVSNAWDIWRPASSTSLIIS